MSTKPNYLKGATILAAAAIITRIIGAVYRIPLARLLGNEGMALFGVSHEIFVVILNITATGFPIALSRMISRSYTLNEHKQIQRTFSVALTVFFVMGIFGALFVAFSPEMLASFMESPLSAQSIFALWPAVLCVSLMGAYRGYAQGLSNMTPTSVSQVIESFLRFAIGLALVWMLLAQDSPLSTASAGAVWGTSLGTVVAFFFLFFYKKRLDRNMGISPATSSDIPVAKSQTFKTLLKISLPITLAASILSIINLTSTFLIMSRLQHAAGFSEEGANFLFGAFFNVRTIFNLPATFIVPLTTSLLPAIVAYLSQKDDKTALVQAQSGLKIMNILALAAGVGLIVLATPIVQVLYPTIGDEGNLLMAIMGAAAYFFCLLMLLNVILQAYGLEKYTIISILIGGVVRIALEFVLLGMPHVHIYGAAIGTAVCFLVASIMNFYFIRTKIQSPPKFWSATTKPLICSLLMGAVAFVIYTLSIRLLPMVIALGLAIAVAGFVYLVLIVITKTITYDDMLMLPRGKALAKLLRMKAPIEG